MTFNKLRYFLRHLQNKFRKQCPSHVVLKNQFPKDTKKYVIGAISFCYFKVHDCILARFYFKGFYETDRRLYWENYWFDN